MPSNLPISAWPGKSVWLVGASSGIGQATAHALHAQGIEFRRPLKSSPRLEAAVKKIREVVPALGPDRVLSSDFTALAEAVAAGKFLV